MIARLWLLWKYLRAAEIKCPDFVEPPRQPQYIEVDELREMWNRPIFYDQDKAEHRSW